MPGSYVFRMLSGLIQLPGTASPNLLAATVSNGAVTTLVVVGTAIGLTLPMYVRDMVQAAGARRHNGAEWTESVCATKFPRS